MALLIAAGALLLALLLGIELEARLAPLPADAVRAASPGRSDATAQRRRKSRHPAAASYRLETSGLPTSFEIGSEVERICGAIGPDAI